MKSVHFFPYLNDSVGQSHKRNESDQISCNVRNQKHCRRSTLDNQD